MVASAIPELGFEDEDYAPSERHPHVTATSSRCCATLLQEPQRLSFNAVEMNPDVYPPTRPKVTSRVPETVTAEWVSAEPAIAITFLARGP